MASIRASSATRALGRLWKGWKRIGKKVADVQSRLLLTVFYFLVIAPFALVVRAATDPLAIKPASPKGWRIRSPVERPTLARARQQS